LLFSLLCRLDTFGTFNFCERFRRLNRRGSVWTPELDWLRARRFFMLATGQQRTRARNQ